MIFALSTSLSLNWSELLNVGLIYQAAAQGCESCKLMLIVNRRLKRCKMSPPQKRWKANSSSSSATALLAAASIELKLYRVWYTGFYPAFTGWLIQYAAKQGRISSVIKKYELKGRPSPIVRVTVECNQLYPCHISCHIITFQPTLISMKIFFCLHKSQFCVYINPNFRNTQAYCMFEEEGKLWIYTSLVLMQLKATQPSLKHIQYILLFSRIWWNFSPPPSPPYQLEKQ